MSGVDRLSPKVNSSGPTNRNAKRWWWTPLMLLQLLSALMVCGCGTPYRSMKGGAGFVDSQIAPDRFSIGFKGNGHDTSTKVGDFALLRAAELTLSNGFSYFAVMDVTNTSSATPYIERQRYYTYYPPAMTLPPPTFGGVDTYRIAYYVDYEQPRIYFRPGTRIVVQCFKTKPDSPFTYDAAALEESLKRKYNLK